MEELAKAIEHGYALTYVPFHFADMHPHHNPRAHRLLVTYVHLYEDCWNLRGTPAAELDLASVAERVRQGKSPTTSHNHPVIICPDCAERLAGGEWGGDDS